MTLDDLRKIAEAATPGPWESITEAYSSELGDYLGGYIPGVAERFVTEHDGVTPPLSPEDAKFIATFNPQKVLELLEETERLQKLVGRWERAYQEHSDEHFYLRTRLAAVEELHEKPPTITGEICTSCVAPGESWPEKIRKAVRDEK